MKLTDIEDFSPLAQEVLTKNLRVEFANGAFDAQIRSLVAQDTKWRDRFLELSLGAENITTEEEGQAVLDELVQLLVELVRSWNITDDNDRIIDVTVENISKFTAKQIVVLLASILVANSNPKALVSSSGSEPSTTPAKPQTKSSASSRRRT